MILNDVAGTDALWQMSLAERAAVLYLIGRLPTRKIAVEVGTYRGGFLRVLAQHFERVFSMDINHANVLGKDSFSNVTWVEGDSSKTLPALLDVLQGEDVGLILIDGDHSYDAVMADIVNALAFTPAGEAVILIHDSWHKPTRDAISSAPWDASPFVLSVEKDFVPGDLGQCGLVGGLAVAVLSRAGRTRPLVIGQAQDFMWRTFEAKFAGRCVE